jgi:sugar O-acyltransferase (sialic acid O-acetyltransferase NeuD family)
MSRPKIILIGAGGHCKVCIDAVEQQAKYSIAGILGTPEQVGTAVLGYTIIGTDQMIHDLDASGHLFLIAVGQIKSSEARVRIYNQLTNAGAKLATVVAPGARVSPHATLGSGTLVMPGACVNAGAHVGLNNILNTGCIVEHDVVTGAHCHISTNAVINGGTKIGDRCFIGSNATVSNGIELGNEVIIGAASLVLKNCMDPGVYIGNPVRKL